MTIGLLKDIADIRPRNARLMGFDIGKKTIGLALSDPNQRLATPLTTIKRKKFTQDVQEIQKYVHDYDVEGFVVGLPLNMDGSEGPRAQSIRDFAIEFERKMGQKTWISLHDERFSTVSAENLVDGSVKRRKAKDAGVIDKLAAQVILQDALDFLLT